MIHPSQLTKEAGFEEGVVVEIEWIPPYDHEFNTFSDAYLEMAEDIISIRPLTGPMAIWNFAPEWAESCIMGMNGVYWVQGSRPEDSDWPDLGNEKITFRPWWAK